MSDALVVRHLGRTVGALTRAAGGELRFRYDDEWLFVHRGFPISERLPLSEREHDGGDAASFFRNLLPEGGARLRIARLLGVSEGNDFELLRRLGADCAGALEIVDEEDDALAHAPDVLPLSASDLGELLTSTTALPKLLGQDGVRLSLAGAQDKLPVVKTSVGLGVPRYGAASTHILKLPSATWKGLPENEALVMTTARRVGLEVPDVELLEAGGACALLVERYDRQRQGDVVVRLHQQDLCQALGLPPEQKYEDEGGPTFARVYEAVLAAVVNPLLAGPALLRWLAFNVVVHNADAHAKNVAILRTSSDAQELAPFYDLVCTGAYDGLSKALATRVGGEGAPGQVRGAHWDALAAELRVGKRLVRSLVEELAEAVPVELDAAARELTERWGSLPRLQQVRETVRRQAQRTRALLAT